MEIEFPFTHDLDRLRDLLPEGWRVKTEFPDLAELTIWAVEARYPSANHLSRFARRAIFPLEVLISHRESTRWT